MINVFDFEGEFANRSVGTQGGFQAAGTCVAIAFGLVGGAIVGEFQIELKWMDTFVFNVPTSARRARLYIVLLLLGAKN